MKQFLAGILLIVFSFTAMAATPIGSLGIINTQQVAGVIFNIKDSNFIALTGYVDTGGAYSCLVDSTGACYQVPGGKSLHIYAVRFNSSVTNQGISFGYSTASNGTSQSTPPTGLTFFFGGQGAARFLSQNTGAARTENVQAYNAIVPTGNYPASQADIANNTYFNIYGYLE